MARMFIFGCGYSAGRLAQALRFAGWAVSGTGRGGDTEFAEEDAVLAALGRASHVLSSVPPAENDDPVLSRYGPALDGRWLGYLSSTGVYGDHQGAWVDESTAIGSGRRTARADADARWLAAGARVFRLPGIYGPGRSAFERIAQGRAHRVDMADQVFSRIHVDDIVGGIMAALASDAPPGAYNLADDVPTHQNAVIEEACRLMGVEPPPLMALEDAGLSPLARAFYAENRRVANGKAKRALGWRLRYPSYREGLVTCRQT